MPQKRSRRNENLQRGIAAILIMAASIGAGQSWDLRLPYASLRVTLRVGTQKQPTFMHLLTGLRLQHPPRGSHSLFWGRRRINAAFRQVWERRIYAAARRQSENCRAPKAKMRIAEFEVGPCILSAAHQNGPAERAKITLAGPKTELAQFDDIE